MSEENLNHEEDIIDETTADGEGSENINEGEKEFVDKVNSATGKNFPSIDAIAKSLKQQDKDFAEKGRQAKKNASQNLDNESDISEELLLIKNPEAETVLDDIKVVAESKYGGNVIKAYREESWLQEKATNEMQKEENFKKIKSPSSSVRRVEAPVKITDHDRKMADQYFQGDMKRWLKYKNRVIN